MFRHGPAAAGLRLLPAWPGAAASWAGPGPQRRRYRARPQDPQPGRGRCSLLPLLPPPPPPLPPPPPPPSRAPPRAPPARSPAAPRLPETRTPIPIPPEGTVLDAAAVLLLRAPPNPRLAPGGPPRPPPPGMEQHLALMHQKLRHELPNFFLKIPDYALYSPDVEFVNRPLRLRTRGRAMYQVAVALCRAAAWGYFASLRLEVLALTQHPEDWSIRARWRLTGLPFHLCLLRFYRRDKRELLRSYDAFSTFFLDSHGLIRCHHVDKLMPAPPAVSEAKKLLVAAAAVAAAAGLAEPGTGPALRLALKPPGPPGPPGAA